MASSSPGSCGEAAPAGAQVPEGAASAGVDTAQHRDSAAPDPRWAQLQKAALKLPQETKDCPCTEGAAGNAGAALGLSRDPCAAPKGSCHTEGLHSAPAQQPRSSAPASGGGRELQGAPLALEERAEGWISKAAEAGESCSSGSSSHCTAGTQDRDAGGAPEARPSSNGSSSFQVHQNPEQVEPREGSAPSGHREEEQQQQRVTEATVCAKNSKVSSTGEKVVLWTREADRVILTTCQEKGAHLDTFQAISQKLGNKTASEVSHRFRELMRLFHTSCDGSSEDEEDATSTSNTDQLSDKDLLLSEEEPDD